MGKSATKLKKKKFKKLGCEKVVGGYYRKEIIPIEIVYEAVKDKLFNKRGHRDLDEVYLNGDMIRANSQRYQLFFTKGIKCVCCGLEGQYFAKERSDHTYLYHLNLYGINSDGEEVMMTKDHIIPVSKGGKSHISNYQTMCIRCNKAKADRLKH